MDVERGLSTTIWAHHLAETQLPRMVPAGLVSAMPRGSVVILPVEGLRSAVIGGAYAYKFEPEPRKTYPVALTLEPSDWLHYDIIRYLFVSQV